MSKSISKPFISVIIPAYNSAKFIRKCLNSAISQTFKDIEIICIDDCSEDNTAEILQEYANRDARIKIITNQTKQYAGISRNIGVEAAVGEYIFYLDSDDYLQENALETVYKASQKNPGIDVIITQLNFINYYTGLQLKIPPIPNSYTNRIMNIQTDPDCIKFMNYAVIAILIRRKMLIDNSILFKNYKSLEDVEYAHNLYIYAKNIIFLPDKVYNYRYNRRGSVASKKYTNLNVLIDALKNLERHKEEIPEEVYKRFRIILFRSIGECTNDGYSLSKISYNEFKYIYEDIIDHSLFSEPEMKYCKAKYERFKRCTPLKFKIISIIIYLIKNQFPTYYTTILKIQQKLRLKRNAI